MAAAIGEAMAVGLLPPPVSIRGAAVRPWRCNGHLGPLPLHRSCNSTGKIVAIFSWKSSRRNGIPASTGEAGDAEINKVVQGSQLRDDGDDDGPANDSSMPSAQVEIAPSVLQVLETYSSSSSSTSLIEQNQRRRREQKDSAAVVNQVPPTKLDAHLSALNALLGPKEVQPPLPIPAVPSSEDKNSRHEELEGESNGDAVTDEQMRYVMSLLKQPLTQTEAFVDLDIATSEWWYRGAVLLWTTLGGAVARMNEFKGDESTYGETMDKEASFVVRALIGDLDPKEALDTNFRQVRTDSDMVSPLFVGADGRGLNEDRNAKTEWLFLANMYSQMEKKPSLRSVWGERDWLLKNVFLNSSFTVVGEPLRCQHGLLFFGTISGESVTETRKQLQERLNKNYFFNMMPIMLKEVRSDDEVQCLICLPQSILSLQVPKVWEDAMFVALSVGVALGSSLTIAADPGFDTLFQWQQAVVPLSLLAVLNANRLVRGAVASAYSISHQLKKPWFLPIPFLGAFSSFTPYVGCLPNRKCLLDLSIYSSVTSLVLSSIFILASSYFSVPAQGVGDRLLDLTGFVATPSDLLAHSGPLTWLMRQLSVAAAITEDGGLYIISPWALAGILGLHVTAMGLLPIGVLDGGRIVTALIGRGGRFLRLLTLVTVAASIGACKSQLTTGAWVLFMLLASGDDWYQLDEVTEPDLLTKIVAGLLVLGGAACFLVPVEWIGSIS